METIYLNENEKIVYDPDTNEILLGPSFLLPTPSVTPSLSISVTPSLSISETPSLSISVTPSSSIAVTPSLSLSPSITISPSPSLTPLPYSGFTTEWTVSGDATARTITLPFTNNGTYSGTIDWGDGSISGVTAYNDTNRIHTYSSNGTYIVQITGSTPGWSFNNGGDKLKCTDIIYWGDAAVFSGFSYLNQGFLGCSNLKSTGKGKMTGTVTQLGSLFQNCVALTGATSGFLDNVTSVTYILGLFANCSAIVSAGIPNDLFKNLILVTDVRQSFQGTKLAYDPPDLFKYNRKIDRFDSVFASCTSLTGITDGNLFSYSTGSTIAFISVFNGCTNLETVPDGILSNIKGNYYLTVFQNCNKLRINPWTFYLTTGDTLTRFLNLSPNFTNCFNRATFTGSQGSAPDLWNCSFGTGTPTSATCFAGVGNDLTSISNYGDIPAGWK